MPTSNLIKINRRFCPGGLMRMCKFFIHEPVRRTYFPVSLGVQWAQMSVLVRCIQQGQLDGVHSRNWGNQELLRRYAPTSSNYWHRVSERVL